MSLLDINNIEDQGLYKYLAEVYIKIRKHRLGPPNSLDTHTKWSYGGIVGDIDDDMVLISQQYLGPISEGIKYELVHSWISKNHPTYDISSHYHLYYGEGSSRISRQVTPSLVQELIPKYDHILNI